MFIFLKIFNNNNFSDGIDFKNMVCNINKKR